jgi:hypothetical protein
MNNAELMLRRFFMKNTIKLFGIIFLVAVIGFTMVTCDNGNDKQETLNQTPVAGDYIFDNLYQTAGLVTAVTITAKNGKSPGMVQNIQYNGSITVPQIAGLYAVTFDVAASTGWNKAIGLYAGNLEVYPSGGGEITYTATANNTTNTTAINFTFNQGVSGLQEGNITITNGTGAVTKGSLSGSGNAWILGITVITAGNVTVSISKAGIESGTKNVSVSKASGGGEITYTATANNTTNTTAINFTFNQGVSGLQEGNITITNGTGAVTKGSLNGSGNSWILGITVITAGNITVSISKAGIESGTKNVSVSKAEPTLVAGSTLADKLAWLNTNAVSNTTYVLELTAIEELLAPHELSYSNKSNITLHLKGIGTERTVSLSYFNGSLFTVGEGVTLVLDENIILQGHSSNDASLISVNGGTLIMNEGSKITSNISSSYGGGGGVYVYSGGTFTMNGGEISGNTARNGGGVCVYGTFTMNGGEISGNTTDDGGGGGVYVYDGGTFTMNGGKISDNTYSSSSYDYGGGGVYVNYGTFTMSGGEISSNTSNANGGGVFINGTYETFTMSGGEISGNTANRNGGGVYVNRGTFTMSGGEISGNTADYGGGVHNNGTFHIVTGTIYGSNTATPLRNTATNGSALYNNNSAQRGIFNGDTWSSYGNLSTTENTFRVLNGNLVQ